ncbi:hypothetical protein E2320_001159 [Naja naja]|nr:hypothetical protein E2320_001159 [Naja naja]
MEEPNRQPEELSADIVVSMAQSALSDIIGQFIVLQNYRVNFKRATEVEDCQFYLILECFQVMPMKREGKNLQNCNRELSIIQKIKDLWQKGFARETWFNSEQESQSVSQVLKDVNQDQLNILKQAAKDCLNLLGTSKLLDSEQLAVYSETKWQLERKQNKTHEDIFTVPAEYLVISAENEAALSQSYISNTPQAVPEEDEDVDEDEEDDRSTVSFFSADSASLDGSLENPWDAVPGITLSTSSELIRLMSPESKRTHFKGYQNVCILKAKQKQQKSHQTAYTEPFMNTNESAALSYASYIDLILILC